MKKLALLFFMMITGFGLIAQNSQVVSAWKYLDDGKLDKAKIAIDKAAAHSKTSEKAKTWYYYGNVYLQIAVSPIAEYKNLDPDPLTKAYDGYLKARELDEREQYLEDINGFIQACAEQFYNSGVNYYNMSDYEKSMYAFGKSVEINENEGRIDSLATYNAALTAKLAGHSEKAKAYFKKLVSMQYQQPDIYSSLAEIEKADGDTVAAMKYVQQGREIYPDDFNLIIAETNIYLATGELEKAMELLQLAIDKDDSNPTLFFAVGTNYDQIGNFEKAEKNYKNAIALDPEYFDANYNLGALYVNRAIEILADADALPLDEEAEYNALKEKANSLLEQSLPYLEKADTLQPDDPYTLRTLKDIYTRLGMLEKLKGVNERLGE